MARGERFVDEAVESWDVVGQHREKMKREASYQVIWEGFGEDARGVGLGREALWERVLAICEGSSGGLGAELAIDGEFGDVPAGAGAAMVEGLLSEEYRREKGAHMTPPEAASALVGCAGELPPGPLVDLSCGHGELLLAMRRRWPRRDLFGVEWHPMLAIAAAARLVIDDEEARQRGDERGGATIVIGDGLEEGAPWIPESGFAAVVGNPPYVAEKGRAGFFRDLQARHGHLGEVFSPRMDLLYLFLWRGVQLTVPGGWNLWLTPPYWLTASGARSLRRCLTEAMEARHFAMIHEPGLFAASPGSEHLVTALQRGGERRGGRVWRGSLREMTGELEGGWSSAQVLAEGALRESGWHPFAGEGALRWGAEVRESGEALEGLARDYQGFVSGADRVTRRHAGRVRGASLGEPIFLADGVEPPKRWEEAPPGLIRPVLRARHLEKNVVFTETPGETRVLYVDDDAAAAVDRGVMERLLGEFRQVLEARREVKTGRMSWCRLHWPRDRTAMEGPKLVVPRRAREPLFSLDLSGAMVSSDCTFLVAPREVGEKARYLCGLMLLLNAEETHRYLRTFGKRKGELLEFYSEPLRRIPLPARVEGGELRLDRERFDEPSRRAFWERVESLLGQAG